MRSSLALFRSRWYVLGILIAFGSWGFHSAALTLAPISLVQTVIAGGLVLLTVIANRLFGFTVSRREWIGVALTGLGLAFLAATLGGTGDEAHADWDAAPLTLYVSASAAVGLAAAFAARRSEHGGTLLAVSAGLIWGASDVSIKAASHILDQDGVLAVLTHPLSLVILVASLVGLSVSARSLQVGEAVPVIAVTSAAANICTIASGPLDLWRAGARRPARAGGANRRLRSGGCGRLAHPTADPRCRGGSPARLAAGPQRGPPRRVATWT